MVGKGHPMTHMVLGNNCQGGTGWSVTYRTAKHEQGQYLGFAGSISCGGTGAELETIETVGSANVRALFGNCPWA